MDRVRGGIILRLSFPTRLPLFLIPPAARRQEELKVARRVGGGLKRKIIPPLTLSIGLTSCGLNS